MNNVQSPRRPDEAPKSARPLVWVIAPPDLAALYDLFENGPIPEESLTDWFCGLRTATLYEQDGQ